MVRIVKQHEERRNELLDAAQALFYRKGYENTSVNDIIDAVGVAKGTFYHYFTSKVEILDQIIERQMLAIDAAIDKVLEEPEENAIIELQNIYAEISQYKVEQKKVMLMLANVLYRDENILLKSKMITGRVRTITPKIARIIDRGTREGVFNTGNPEYVAEMILNMGFYLGDEFGRMVITGTLNEQNRNIYIEKIKTLENGIARILGLPDGSLELVNKEVIVKFFE